MAGFDVVTGAFSYTGKYIARILLGMGREVRTLTGHPGRPNPFGGRVAAWPFNFDDPRALAGRLRGADTLYNTYWIRFPRGRLTYDLAVRNSMALIDAARATGVRRLVHISIANASATSRFPYYRGKAEVEEAVAASGLPYAIVRPTVLFGHEDILINNIAWMLRRFPVFAVPGDGRYYVQPVFVEDVAALAVSGAGEEKDTVIDAAGPEAYTFDGLVGAIREAVRSKSVVVHVWPRAALLVTEALGWMLGDVVLTRDEVEGLVEGLLESKVPPLGNKRLSDWLKENSEAVGRGYASEIERHYR